MIGFLFSYWYFRQVDVAKLAAELLPRPALFADSGAFSAHSQNGTVDLGAYAEWLHRWGEQFDAYASLDDKTSWRAGLRNHEALLARGLHPVPVVHAGEPWQLLADYCADHDYVALGGLAGAAMRSADPRVQRWLSRAFDVAADHGTRLHGFGLFDWRIVRRFPWHSVDSSVIGVSYRYGQVRAYDPYKIKWRLWNLHDPKAWGRWGWLVREYDEDPQQIYRTRRESQDFVLALMRLGAKSFRRAMDQLPHPTQVYVVDSAADFHGTSRPLIFHQAANPEAQPVPA